ncbi:MAG: hypothetical protein IJZ59_06760 [Alphaproteobacteria bacterium]|nr:hypothetical protein [Alphaproteobacteria bacterium]
MRNLLAVKLREDEKIVCRIKSHWYYYFVSLLFVPMAIYDVFLFPIIFYTLLLALWQGVVITNRRVICRGGWFFVEKSFALPKFLLTRTYIRPKVLEDLFSLTLIEDGNKKRMFCAKITNAQIKFLKNKYEVEIKKSWLYQI